MGWFVWALGAALGWGIWALFSALAARTGSALPTLAVTLLIEAVVVLPFLGRARTVALGWCVATAIAGVVAYWMFFRALEAGPAGPATAVTAIYPVVTALLAVPVLRQAFTLRTAAGIVLAVAAAVVLGSSSS